MNDTININPLVTINRKNLFIKMSVNIGVINSSNAYQTGGDHNIIQELLNVTIDFNREDQLPIFVEKLNQLLKETAEAKKSK